ncbi:hypothetical protein [Paludisphaera mucosa]|uniref:Uncharacterized protein n=1 Tax=Paludisphaera mucosa TaxID=3030827 RepID=A0ABT6F4I3_9BACT|nr:hypothetical protein [Paludisphaera mucosa]MDG3002329.1 hypothetical protein [Paludisphaera mucosa]
MLRRELLRSLSLTTWLGRLRGIDAWAGAGDEAPNAADAYRRAFAWVRKVPSERWGEAREALETARLGPEVDRWIEESRPALEAIREAAKIDACRWGDDEMTAADIDRDRLGIANRHIVRMTCLSVRRLVEARRFDEALDDAFSALAYARRVGADGPFIARLFECADEAVTLQTLGRVLTRLDRPALDRLAHRLDGLPPVAPPSGTIGPESRFILGTLRGRLAAMGAVVDDEGWKRLDCDDAEIAALRRLTGGDRAKLLAHLDATVPDFAELGRRLDLPRGGRDEALDAFARARRDDAPLAAGLVEAARGIAAAVERQALLRVMLRAGFALVRDGEDAFRALRDPFGDGPFGLERREGGRVLRSAFPGLKSPATEFRVGEPG